MKNCGKHEFLIEVFSKTGASMLGIMSQPLTVYQRSNGTYFVKPEGKRDDIARRADGSFYKAYHQ